MKTMAVGDFKARFSDTLEEVKKGEEIVICYGRKKQKIAIILPYAHYDRKMRIRLGLLKGKASYEFSKSFKMSTEEIIGT